MWRSCLNRGLVAAIPFVSQLVQIPFAALAENFGRKKVSFVANLISRISLLLIAGACLTGSITWFVVIFVIYSVFKEISAVAWSSWMRDLLPLNIRGEFYAKRVAYGKFASLMVVLAVAAIFHFASDSLR
ncbi:hypothetical protein [Archaeoglobus veneficus]|uniref:hypothetical protein n=1 Tax=Archaeoglobus veneficus TaxID=58290 RepID=UPI00064FF933|nr:hypothetical protein [Archaeoglobus veneficus]